MVFITLYFFIALLAINNEKVKNIKFLYSFIFVLLILIAGSRWEVGGDWQSYVEYYDTVFGARGHMVGRDPLAYILFYAFNSVLKFLNFDILGKNIVLITLFLFPFYYVFKKFYKNTYFALCIFIPIIFLVYGLGSIRQGLAISYFYLFLYYEGNKYIKYTLFVVPIFFHPGAGFIMVFYFFTQFISFSNLKIFFINSFSILVISSLVIFLLQDFLAHSIKHYGPGPTGSYSSKGAPIRAMLLSLLSIFYLLKFKNLSNKPINKFLFYSSILIIFLTPFSFYLSTPVDRILGFFMILKLIILDKFLKSVEGTKEKMITLVLIMLGFFYLVAWLYTGENSAPWLNYEIYFMKDIN